MISPREIRKTRDEAKQLLGNDQLDAAAGKYKQLAKYYEVFAKQATSHEAKQRRMDEAEECRLKAENLSDRDNAQAPPQQISNKESSTSGESEDDNRFLHEVRQFKEVADVEWDDIGGLDDAKEEIQLVYGMALCQKPNDVSPPGWKNILLHGPPGTGKTLLASAISNNLGSSFFNVKASNVLSKWVGESSKIISALFKKAYQEADQQGFSVIFFDEFDAVARSRDEGTEEYAHHMLSTLLVEMDGLANKENDSGVIFIASTNKPHHLDTAILSRFDKRIFIGLPDEEARKQILRIHFENYGVETEVNRNWLVERTEDFSGRNIERLCKEAVNIMISERNESLLDRVQQGREDVEEYELATVPLSKRHFQDALNSTDVNTNQNRKIEKKAREIHDESRHD